jgi:hypothetical protein
VPQRAKQKRKKKGKEEKKRVEKERKKGAKERENSKIFLPQSPAALDQGDNFNGNLSRTLHMQGNEPCVVGCT